MHTRLELTAVVLAALSLAPACSKSKESKALIAYEYDVSTPKRLHYPDGVELYLGQERVGVLGDYHEGLERYTVEFSRPLDAPLSGALAEGLSLRWASPCGPQNSKLAPVEGDAQAKSFLVEHEGEQSKHGSGTASIEVEEASPSGWASKATLFWADTKSDAAELRVGELRVPIERGKGARVFALDCADTHEVELEGSASTLDAKVLAAARDMGWDERILARHVFIGQPDKCYALHELAYTTDGTPIDPKTRILKGGEAHVLADGIDYFLEDAPSAVEFEVPADEVGLHSVITQYELELVDCEAAQPETVEMPNCFDSCREVGGTEKECEQVCKDSESR